MTSVSISEFCAELAKVHGPCHRKIHVEVDPEDDKKVQHGERNNIDQPHTITPSQGFGCTRSTSHGTCLGNRSVDFGDQLTVIVTTGLTWNE
jgi:hypothetical protein